MNCSERIWKYLQKMKNTSVSRPFQRAAQGPVQGILDTSIGNLGTFLRPSHIPFGDVQANTPIVGGNKAAMSSLSPLFFLGRPSSSATRRMSSGESPQSLIRISATPG